MLEKIRLEAESLSATEKEQLIDILSASLYSQAELEQAWFEELERRRKNLETGKSSAINWEIAKSKIEKQLEATQNR